MYQKCRDNFSYDAILKQLRGVLCDSKPKRMEGASQAPAYLTDEEQILPRKTTGSRLSQELRTNRNLELAGFLIFLNLSAGSGTKIADNRDEAI